MTALVVWRHPKPRVEPGLCVGCADVAVDRRRAKRLAHRVRAWARRNRAAPVVHTSGLQRCQAVGQWLRRWGWRHVVDARLAELDFGAWTGRPWQDIGAAALDAWCADFAEHAPGGGESVAQLLARCAAFIAEPRAAAPCLVVGHAGWISAAAWLAAEGARAPEAADWPPAIGYAACARIDVPFALNQSQSTDTAQRSQSGRRAMQT
jgi:alpha-ribazole phosphatase